MAFREGRSILLSMNNRPRLALVCLFLVSGPLPAFAQIHGQIAGGSSARLPGLISSASLINSGSVSTPLMPTVSLNGVMAAPAPTANAVISAPIVVNGASLNAIGVEAAAHAKPTPAAETGAHHSLVDLSRQSPAVSFDGGLERSGDIDAPSRATRAPVTEADMPNSYVATFRDDEGLNSYEFKLSADHTLKFSGEFVDLYSIEKVPVFFNGTGTWSFKDGNLQVQLVGTSFVRDRPASATPASASLVMDFNAKSTSDLKLGTVIFVTSKYFGNLNMNVSYAPTANPTNQQTTETNYVSTKASKIVAIQLLNEIGNNVDLKNGGGALTMSYDEKFLSYGGPNQSETTIGADKVISLLQTDEDIKFWLKKDADYLAARLDEMQKAGRLKTVHAILSVTDETYAVRFDIYTNDGWALFLKLARAKSPKNI